MNRELIRGVGILAAAMLCSASLSAQLSTPGALPVAKHASPPAYGPHLSGKQVTLPLVLVKGYPFVDGAINGKKGKLLFDAGESAAFAVNTHAVAISSGVRTGSGFFGSGQKFEVFNLPVVDKLTLSNGLQYTDLTNIRGNPGLPIEQHITPDFIGWIGVGFYAGYVMKLDYALPSATFYRDDVLDSGGRAALSGEHVVQVIRLSPTEHPNLLNFRVKVNGTEYLALLDTGSHVAAWLSKEQIAAATQAGSLHKEDDGSMTLQGMTIDGESIAPMPVLLTEGKPPMADKLPATDDPVVTLGYEFLQRYKTVWDYDGGTFTLLKLK